MGARNDADGADGGNSFPLSQSRKFWTQIRGQKTKSNNGKVALDRHEATRASHLRHNSIHFYSCAPILVCQNPIGLYSALVLSLLPLNYSRPSQTRLKFADQNTYSPARSPPFLSPSGPRRPHDAAVDVVLAFILNCEQPRREQHILDRPRPASPRLIRPILQLKPAQKD